MQNYGTLYMMLSLEQVHLESLMAIGEAGSKRMVGIFFTSLLIKYLTLWIRLGVEMFTMGLF